LSWRSSWTSSCITIDLHRDRRDLASNLPFSPCCVIGHIKPYVRASINSLIGLKLPAAVTSASQSCRFLRTYTSTMLTSPYLQCSILTLQRSKPPRLARLWINLRLLLNSHHRLKSNRQLDFSDPESVRYAQFPGHGLMSTTCHACLLPSERICETLNLTD